MTKLFEMVFNVPMECEGCEQSVRKSLENVTGLENLVIDWKAQVVNVIGYVAPSEIVNSLKRIGKDGIIRGTGKPNSAAVAILESFDVGEKSHSVKGLARMVAVDEDNIVVDLTLNQLPAGTYYPQIRNSGNLSEGAFSTGKLYHSFGPIQLDQSDEKPVDNGSYQNFLEAPLRIQDLIGRSFVLSRADLDISADCPVGVIARSAGAWENDKYICTCSGKTVWQERTDALENGITS